MSHELHMHPAIALSGEKMRHGGCRHATRPPRIPGAAPFGAVASCNRSAYLPFGVPLVLQWTLTASWQMMQSSLADGV